MLPPGMLRSVTVLFAATVLSLIPSVAPAASRCDLNRFAAADHFAQCRHHAAKYNDITKYHAAIGKCLTKYRATWPKIQAASALDGSACATDPRFVDHGDGTVTDTLTGLLWEKKTDDATLHDKDELYAWSASGTAADGSAFVGFLATLNQPGSCFAAECDWRLPTLAEIQSIADATFPNCGGPCVDPAFGPTTPFPSWSAQSAPDPSFAWSVTSVGAELATTAKTVAYAVRAVRGGL